MHTTLTPSFIDELTAIVTAPDPRPAEPWRYHTGNARHRVTEGDLGSIGQLRDLLVTLPDDHFLVVEKVSVPGVFTQVWREGRPFVTECSIPNEWGNLLHQYHTVTGGPLPLSLAHLVMEAYIRTGGHLPQEWQGPEPVTRQF